MVFLRECCRTVERKCIYFNWSTNCASDPGKPQPKISWLRICSFPPSQFMKVVVSPSLLSDYVYLALLLNRWTLQVLVSFWVFHTCCDRRRVSATLTWWRLLLQVACSFFLILLSICVTRRKMKFLTMRLWTRWLLDVRRNLISLW